MLKETDEFPFMEKQINARTSSLKQRDSVVARQKINHKFNTPFKQTPSKVGYRVRTLTRDCSHSKAVHKRYLHNMGNLRFLRKIPVQRRTGSPDGSYDAGDQIGDPCDERDYSQIINQ